MRLKGQHETSGTLLDIDASSLVDGRAIRVTSLDKLTSGALLICIQIRALDMRIMMVLEKVLSV